MKKAKDISDLASRLTVAATTPVLSLAPAPEAPPAPSAQAAAAKPAKVEAAKKRGSVSVFLRLPPNVHAGIEAEAIARTKKTGRGVTVQQVILDKLAGAL